MAYYLDFMVDRREGGTEVIGGMHKCVIPCNWKFAADNFQGDGYHVGWSHITAFMAGFGGTSRRDSQRREGGIAVYAGNGHGLGASLYPVEESEMEPEGALISRYVRETAPEAQQRLGDRATKIWPIHGTVFPNCSLLWPQLFRTIRVWHPKGPDRIELWAWTLVDKAAPAEVKDAVRLLSLRTFSPGGVFEQDDMENWQECTRTSRGVITRRYPHNVQMGLGHERFSEDFPGVIGSSPSEMNQRGFYERWAELMEEA
jgi:hypothetical protein